MSRRQLAIAALGVVLAGCGANPPDAPDVHATAPDLEQRFSARTVVLEDRSHGPMLCLGGMLESYPPQCGDVPITNWSWKRVAGERRAGGTIWGDYQVVGTFDGSSFTVLRARVAKGRVPVPDAHELDTPCPEPRGGWRPVDPTRLSDRDLAAASAVAESSPEYAGAWIDYIGEPPTEEGPVRDDVIWNVAFTGDLTEHERELRKKWGGALCVVEHERTERELSRIQDELVNGVAEELGLHLLSAAVWIPGNTVEITVVVADEHAQAELDERYGEGAVRVTSALRPVG